MFAGEGVANMHGSPEVFSPQAEYVFSYLPGGALGGMPSASCR